MRSRLAKRPAAGARRGAVLASEPKIQKIGVRHGVLGPGAFGCEMPAMLKSLFGAEISLRTEVGSGGSAERGLVILSFCHDLPGKRISVRFCSIFGRAGRYDRAAAFCHRPFRHDFARFLGGAERHNRAATFCHGPFRRAGNAKKSNEANIGGADVESDVEKRVLCRKKASKRRAGTP